MRHVRLAILLALLTTPAGCDYFKGPKLTISTAPTTTQTEGEKAAVRWTPTQARDQMRFHGLTAEQWAKYLEHADRTAILRAARALHVLGAEGRPHLVQGLDSSNPETRRICFARQATSTSTPPAANSTRLPGTRKNSCSTETFAMFTVMTEGKNPGHSGLRKSMLLQAATT